MATRPSDHGRRFREYLESRRPQIELQLSNTAPYPVDAPPAQQFDLLGYLYEPLAQFVASGGKRTRPALCLLGAEAVGADPISALSCAVAMESFQSAALIHDDIADGGELRRGMPCVHRSIGTGLAVNVGDLALVNVFSGLLADPTLEDGICLRVLCEIAYMEERTLEGQALDLGWARDGRWDLTADDYLFMASHKTAFYSASTPLVCGAICGGGTEEQIKALRDFGMDAGLAFQLQDDLLNLVGDAEAQGKDYRSDITEGKRTMAAVLAVSALEGAERDELVGILSSGTTDADELARAVELMESCGAIGRVREHARKLADGAKRRLDGADLANEARETLLSMADYFIERAG